MDESLHEDEAPIDYVRRLARSKAEAVWERNRGCPVLVLGADTVVVVENEILGKPRDAHDAHRMLRQLSNRPHQVLTGVAVISARSVTVKHDETRVWFAELSAADIAEYVATGEPMDKAGAYAIQGRASRFVERIEGSYTNVVGLPVALVYRLLKGYPECRVSAELAETSPDI